MAGWVFLLTIRMSRRLHHLARVETAETAGTGRSVPAVLREARRQDVPEIVALLADGAIGAGFYESLGFTASHEGLKLPLR
jgi:hypothetical protein